MKKLVISALFLLTMLCTSMTVLALTEGDWEYQLLEDHAVITKYTGTAENVIIPDTLAGVPVTEVESSVEFDNGITKSVTFPATVKVIQSVCFDSDTLETVVLPEGVEEIARVSFFGCTNLKNITLPSTLKKIGDGAFEGCNSLTSINFPPSLETIEDSVFAGAGLTSVDMSACTSLKTIPRAAFLNNTNLTSVRLPYGLTEIEKLAFDNCPSLADIEIPGTVSSIGTSAFYNCQSLKSIILPVSLKVLGDTAFKNCTSLEEVILPYGTESVGASFEDCPSLRAVYLPDTITFLGYLFDEETPNAIAYCASGSKAAEECKNRKISYLTDNSVNTLINVLYNGKRISFDKYGKNPEMINDRTLVPLRSIFEAMNATVEWDGATSTVTSTRGDTTVQIRIGASEMYKNGTAIPMDVPAQLIGDFTMVPVRFIAEAFDAKVDWNGNGNVVLINE